MIRAMLSGLLLIVWLMASTVEAADKSDWVDKNYDFRSIQSALVHSMNFDRTSDVGSDIVERELNEIFIETASIPKYRLYYAEETTATTTIAITAELVDYKIETRVIPAHWETRYKETTGRYKDKDGKWREHKVQVPYQEYVPDKYVDDSRVTLRFRAVDAASGKEIFLREESRLHADSSNRKGVFTRICKTFFNDLKKKMK